VDYTDNDTVVLTDADTRLRTPERLDDIEVMLEEQELGGLSFRVVPDDSGTSFLDGLWNRLQDFDYAIGRALTDYTTGERLRRDADDKNVRCVPGAGGAYPTDVLREALEKHSGKHAGDDMETTAIAQLVLGEDINYDRETVFETDVPKTYRDLVRQRVRWSKGAIQTFSENPGEHLREMRSGSRYGQTMAYEAGLTALAPVLAGSILASAAAGDIDTAVKTAEIAYTIDTVFTGGIGAYAARKGELEDRKTLALTPVMPAYRAATFFPSKVLSQAENAAETIRNAVSEFMGGVEESRSSDDIEIVDDMLESRRSEIAVPAD
jgi:hypothetical protein